MLCRESQLLEEIEDLKGKLSYWKAEAQAQADSNVRLRFTERFGLTGAEGWVLAALYARRGRVLPTVQIDENRPGNVAGMERIGNTTQVFITRIRKKMGAGTIETVRGTKNMGDGGYRLSDNGVALCDAALQPKH